MNWKREAAPLGAMLSLIIICSTASATPMVHIDRTISREGNDIYAMSLDLGDLNGNINVFEVTITPDQGEFLNISPFGIDSASLIPHEAGAEATFTNALISLPPPLGGLGLIQLGGYDEVRNRFFYAAGPLGERITLDGSLFIN
ncbi:MAG: hypothetical protein GXP24_11255, partial [Planctomycetes bacterium]|nr:hypothetical protein [Planctomycetota bacterium]